jgi:hypothetical protein
MDHTDETISPQQTPVAQLRGPTHRQCNGARLGNKRYEVERMLLEGEPKLKIARALKISAHSVRAVARQLGEEAYAALSGSASTVLATEVPAKTLPDRLRDKAIQAVDAITVGKLEKSSPQACAIVADRLLGRADALETRCGHVNFIGEFLNELGAQRSHAVSRLTLEQKVTVETQQTPEASR